MALVKGRELWLANLGDCCAILCKEGHKAQTITTDHAPAKSEAEAERLRQLGVDVRGGYVGEHIAISRAFGNVCFATGKKLAGVLHEPEVHLLEIDDRTDFLILGSDGIWDSLKAQFAVTHARKALRTTEEPQDAATAILENAAKVSAADNAAAVVVVFRFSEPFVSVTHLCLSATCRSLLRLRLHQESVTDVELDGSHTD